MIRQHGWKVRLELTSPEGKTVYIHIEGGFRKLQDCFNFVEDFSEMYFPAYVLEEVKLS